MPVVTISNSLVQETIGHLQQAGHERKECVVLWLAVNGERRIDVRNVYRPDQIASADIFRIPTASMRVLMTMLSAERLIIAAQVHSHPAEAFHSAADDAWAIVRHAGALSLVVPHFALSTNVRSFIHDMRLYQLDRRNRWTEIAASGVEQCLRIV